MAVPKLQPEQRRAAAQKAIEVRRIRADLKQMLKTGEVTIAEVLKRAKANGARGEALAKMKVVELLEALPNYGKVRARKVMERLEIAPTRRIRGLGANQKAALLEEFDA